jgi:hypothetical protein
MTEVAPAKSRLSTVPQGWTQDLVFREEPLLGQPDGQDEINHLDDRYLEFSRASDVVRGFSLVAGLCCLGVFVFGVYMALFLNPGFRAERLIFIAIGSPALPFAWFFVRFDLRLPRDSPVRFNRHQAKVYFNYFTWTYNPFGKWPTGVKVWDWNTVQACIAYRVGAAGEVVTQRYDLLLVSCKPGTLEVVDTFRLQQGAMTTRQYEDLWALLRHYMAKGLEDLPPQNLRNPNPAFIDCLLFAIPWFSPTEEGRRARARMKGFWGTVMMVLMSLLFPLWLLFGLGNYIVNKLAPEAVWPADVDALSKSAGPQAAR